jgi:alanine-synthesizing transaminase
VDLAYMTEIVDLARQYGTYIIHDFAYAELAFDGYRPPSILKVPGATDYAVEIYSMTKTFNMAGWRVGYCLGNRHLIAALTRIKSYLDYGGFQPIQIAAVTALNECQDAPAEICAVYERRRDVLVQGLRAAGWHVTPPKASMFLWTRIPEQFQHLGSLEFAKTLMKEAHIAVSPGIGFGPMGEGYVRFSLIEEDARVRAATARIAAFFKAHAAATEPVREPVHV